MLFSVVSEIDPASAGDARDLEVRRPLLERAVGIINQRRDIARGGAAGAADRVEVDVMVLVTAERERVVHFESPGLAVDLVSFGRIRIQFFESFADIVRLVRVALPKNFQVGLVVASLIPFGAVLRTFLMSSSVGT